MLANLYDDQENSYLQRLNNSVYYEIIIYCFSHIVFSSEH